MSRKLTDEEFNKLSLEDKKRIIQMRNNYHKNKKKISDQRKKEYPKIREKELQRVSKYYKKNKVKINQYKKRWYIKNKSNFLKKAKAYRKINSDELKKYDHNRDKNKGRKKEKALNHAKYRQRIKKECFSHYSNGKIKCSMCDVDDIDMLVIDHINGNGSIERKRLGNKGFGIQFYAYLKRRKFPKGYQVLCCNHNTKKQMVAYRKLNKK